MMRLYCSIPIFLLLFFGFVICGALTPLVPESAPEISSSSRELVSREGLRIIPLPLPSGSSDLGNFEDFDGSSPLLPDSSFGRGPAARSLLCSGSDEHDRFLFALPDGTIHLVDGRSGASLWKLVTGSPLSYSEQALSDIDYFMYSGDNGHMYEYSKAFGHRELNLTIEELVHRAPEIKGSRITIGSKVTTVYLLDGTTGEMLLRHHLPVMGTEIGMPWVGQKSISSKVEAGKSYIILARTDYTLSSTYLGESLDPLNHLWSIREARFTATNIMSPLPTNIGDNPLLPSMCQGDMRVLFRHAALNPRGEMFGKLMLPSASHSNYPLTLSAQDGEQSPVKMLPSPCNTTNCSVESVRASGQSVFETHQSSLNPTSDASKGANRCLPGICAADNHNAVMLYHKDTSLHFPSQSLMSFVDDSTTQYLNNDAKSHLVEYNTTDKIADTLAGVIYRYLWFLIVSLPIIFVLCYPKFREAAKDSNRQLGNFRVRQSVAPKKRKVRKAGNLKNGSVVSNGEKVSSAEIENPDNNGYTTKNNELFMNLSSVDAVDGRWVGKLFVSNSEIGRGSNGTVVLEGVYDGRPVAVKRLLRAHHDVALKEIQNLIASDQHPNIVRWYGVEQDLDFVYISLERCSCSLSDLIQLCSDSSPHSAADGDHTSSSIYKHKVRLYCGKGIEKDLELWSSNGFPSSQLLKLMRDVVSGLAHLHELGILHRDMKPQNVLISNDRYLNAKLSDMGISKRLLEDMSSVSHHATGYGSSGWQAPEQLLHGRQTRAVDLFSLGCILFFCITKGGHPFGNFFERDGNIVNNRMDLFLVEHIPEAVHLLSQLLDPNPMLRPNAIEVLHHPFFWSSEMRLTFLRDASDRVELEDREHESELLRALENVAPVAFGGKWGEKLDTAFITDMGRYRKYNFDCMRDLLRVIRNKLNHYRELPKELQENLGPVPEGFDRYFSSRFPKLLIEVYKVVCTHCREEDSFGWQSDGCGSPAALSRGTRPSLSQPRNEPLRRSHVIISSPNALRTGESATG